MATDAEQALWAFEEAVDGVLSLVRGASYGLRLATRRVADLVSRPTAPPGAAGAGLEGLREALEEAPDRLSDLAVLALGDHFRAFLARALDLEVPPPLPETPEGVEELAGTPGALARSPFWVPLLLQLYRVALRGGALDRRAVEALGGGSIEIRYPEGKVKVFSEGDRLALTESHLEEAGRALVEAARAIRLRLLTA